MYEFDIRNMTCGHCAAAVEKAIKAADPSAVTAIDLKAKKARIKTTVDPVVISGAIEQAGYPSTFVQI